MAGELKILIVTDKFKGSLSALEAAESIKKGLLLGYARLEIRILPMADGGEGTIDVIMNSSGGELKYAEVYDPLFRLISAPYLIKGNKVFIEMAKCSGLQLLKRREYNPLRTSTYGLGQMILAASAGDTATKICIGIGGSATNDGGMGMLKALGYKFTDNKGEDAATPWNVKEIDDRGVSPVLKRIKFKVACDVNNPLLGVRGATAVYGPQKGANKKMLEELEQGMRNYAKVCERFLGKSYADYPGAGAAGGVGFALTGFLGAQLIPGWKVLSDLTYLESLVKGSDIIITGEGSIDEQSVSGKLISGVAEIAKKYSKSVWAYCGVNSLNENQLKRAGIERVFAISDIESKREKSVREAKKYLEKISFKSATFLNHFQSNRQTY